MAAACGPDYPNCETDDHCTEQGEYCVNQKCSQCRLDEHCADEPGQRCVAGACEKIPGWCQSDNDCSGQEKCREEQCGPQCLSNDECGDTEECKNGACQLKAECALDSDCPSGKKCSSGVCIDGVASSSACDPLEPIYFDFDESSLRADARDTLKNHAKCVQDRSAKVSIEGHCDQRGTEEYNLALGERRARAAMQYMKSLGVRRSSMKTISYGESKPAETGGGASAHLKNRRCEFGYR